MAASKPLPAPAADHLPTPPPRPKPSRPAAPAHLPFPVVVLGGSARAGGLPAVFGQLARRCGLALVVVQHLPAPGGPPSALLEVLRGFTELPVLEITDGLALEAEHVHVAPPGQEVSLLHGTFLLLPPTLPAAQRLLIDFFFQGLAKDARERAVCIIFSGTGSDGVLGLKLVMENFGMVMVQDPATAAYAAMPRAALATEFVDFVLTPGADAGPAARLRGPAGAAAPAAPRGPVARRRRRARRRR